MTAGELSSPDAVVEIVALGRIRIGVSGWSYDEWRGGFHPEDLPQAQELPRVAASLDTVEVNGTFYRLTDPRSVRSWHDSTPYDFRFAVKGSRYITHTKRLSDIDSAGHLLRLGHGSRTSRMARETIIESVTSSSSDTRASWTPSS